MKQFPVGSFQFPATAGEMQFSGNWKLETGNLCSC
jgi:hypothetical protein